MKAVTGAESGLSLYLSVFCKS